MVKMIKRTKKTNKTKETKRIGKMEILGRHLVALITGVCPAFVLFALACSGGEGPGSGQRDARVWDPDVTVEDKFFISYAEPNNGPTGGGTMVTLRGTGFEQGSKVWFGENLVDHSTIQVVDRNRILCKTPVGPVGHVDIKIQNPMGAFALLEDGFHYNAFHVDPPSGTVNGGTFVRIVGTDTTFDATSVVTFNNKELEDIRVVNSAMITGRTPPGAAGSAVVRVKSSDSTWEVPDGFEYYAGSDPVNGGMGGGPIQGELSISLLDAYTTEPIEGAFVILGSSKSTPYQGYTDAAGRIVFSDPELTGPQMMTGAHPEYERVSFVSFDARELTAFMTPIIPPDPGSGGFPGISFSYVHGMIYFSGIEPTGDPCDWGTILPPPEPGYVRTMKVFQTVSSVNMATPSPGTGGIIKEGASCETGFAYSIFTRPGSYAVYVLAGMENETTRHFIPIMLGVHRGINTAPGENYEADIWVDMMLSRSLDVQLEDPPPLDQESGPVVYRTSLFLDMGGDGFMIRPVLVAETTDATETVRFENLAPTFGPISDSSYSLKAQAYNYGTYPYSEVFVRDVNIFSPDPITVGGFLSIPLPISPEEGGVLTDRRLTWTGGGIEPSFQVVYIRTYPKGDPFWRFYLDGNVNSFTLPDLAGVGDLQGFPAGPMLWYLFSQIVPGMEFNDFTYRYMNSRYWTAAAASYYGFQFGAPGY